MKKNSNNEHYTREMLIQKIFKNIITLIFGLFFVGRNILSMSNDAKDGITSYFPLYFCAVFVLLIFIVLNNIRKEVIKYNNDEPQGDYQEFVDKKELNKNIEEDNYTNEK